MLDYDTLTILAIAAASVIALAAAAYVGYMTGADHADAEIATLRDELAVQHADLWQAIHGNDALCRDDSDDIGQLFRRVAALEARPAAENPAPMAEADQVLREAHAGLRQVLALPAPPAVAEAVEPAWNAPTTYERLASLKKFRKIKDDSELWTPPSETARVGVDEAFGRADTTEITGLTVTGELVPHAD